MEARIGAKPEANQKARSKGRSEINEEQREHIRLIAQIDPYALSARCDACPPLNTLSKD
jgi:hypothetical protein